ncbi:aspartate-semialdehyde dehydrogenase [Candidatus Fermentibacteria bacterium]|nr:aspartate-semialdehyde dehydrogenase [Candidatus Fermentibacteria bacterium]
MKEKTPVAVLGATGMVGQQLLTMLQDHPWFYVSEMVASERRAGIPYGETTRWMVDTTLPPAMALLTLKGPNEALASPLVFSCLGARVARDLEPVLVQNGHLVVSNASAFRRNPDVPLLIPEVNPESLRLLSAQRVIGGRGGLVTNPNCVVAGLALGLAPLHHAFRLTKATVVTLQAVSGAGIPGVGAVELVDNLIPWIEGEEDKIAYETARILEAPLAISASVHRVAVLHGHTMSVSISMERTPSREDIIGAWEAFRPPGDVAGLPTCPLRPIVYVHDVQRPQPRLDRMAGRGMSITIGRLRPCPVLGFAFELCVHNLVRGAAGAALLNAELCARRGLIP